MLNSVVKISMMSAKYFEYYTIILRGAVFSWTHCIYIFGLLPPNGILPGAKFTLHPSLAFSYTGSVSAQHSSSGHQPNCGIQQRAPPIFGRAAVTLGISSCSSCSSST